MLKLQFKRVKLWSEKALKDIICPQYGEEAAKGENKTQISTKLRFFSWAVGYEWTD